MEVAVTLHNLGTAYGALGDYAKCRDVLELARVVFERHVEIALNNLAIAYGELGDHVKQREIAERARV